MKTEDNSMESSHDLVSSIWSDVNPICKRCEHECEQSHLALVLDCPLCTVKEVEKRSKKNSCCICGEELKPAKKQPEQRRPEEPAHPNNQREP